MICWMAGGAEAEGEYCGDDFLLSHFIPDGLPTVQVMPFIWLSEAIFASFYVPPSSDAYNLFMCPSSFIGVKRVNIVVSPKYGGSWRVQNDYRWSQGVVGLPSFFIEERIQDRLRSQSQPQKSWGTAVASLVELGYLPHSLGELDYAGVGFVIGDGFGTSSGYRSWGLLGTLWSLSHHTGKCEINTHFDCACCLNVLRPSSLMSKLTKLRHSGLQA